LYLLVALLYLFALCCYTEAVVELSSTPIYDDVVLQTALFEVALPFGLGMKLNGIVDGRSMVDAFRLTQNDMTYVAVISDVYKYTSGWHVMLDCYCSCHKMYIIHPAELLNSECLYVRSPFVRRPNKTTYCGT